MAPTRSSQIASLVTLPALYGSRHFSISRLSTYGSPLLARFASTSRPPPDTSSLLANAGAPRLDESTLARLPLATVMRSYMIMGLSSSPLLLDTASALLRRMLVAKTAVFDVQKNPFLKYVFRRSFYEQFCAGETKIEVQRTIEELRNVGYRGVILELASETLEDGSSDSVDQDATASIDRWKQGVLTTIDMASENEFVAFKWSGMGTGTFALLKEGRPPTPAMVEAMKAVCDAAAKKGVRLLPAAEPQNAQPEVDRWTTTLAADYNKVIPGVAIVYHTYQCYLKSTSSTLAKHLQEAAAGGYTLGVKLVRGAYMDTERRDLIWETREQTHEEYDNIVDAVLRRQFTARLRPSEGGGSAFPSVNVMLATHNSVSVGKARKLRNSQTPSERDETPLTYGQLYGMADEVSLKLLQSDGPKPSSGDELPQVFKYATWGTMKDCLNYLMRRAAENRDAMARTVETRRAMGAELRRRAMRPFRRAGQ